MPIKSEITAPTLMGRVEQMDTIRKGRGLSRRKWLARANVRQSTFYRWLGELNRPSEATVQRLAKALKVKIV